MLLAVRLFSFMLAKGLSAPHASIFLVGRALEPAPPAPPAPAPAPPAPAPAPPALAPLRDPLLCCLQLPDLLEWKLVRRLELALFPS